MAFFASTDRQARARLRAVVFAAAVVWTLALALAAAGPAQAQPDRYIVVLHDSVSSPGAVADDHRRRFGAAPSHVYGHALKGYAALIAGHRVDEVRADSRVAFVDRDEPVEAFGQQVPTGVSESSPLTTRASPSTAAMTSASTPTSR